MTRHRLSRTTNQYSTNDFVDDDNNNSVSKIFHFKNFLKRSIHIYVLATIIILYFSNNFASCQLRDDPYQATMNRINPPRQYPYGYYPMDQRSRFYSPDPNVIFGDNPPQYEVGNFTPWSEPSKCTRECGGGVTVQNRACMNESICYGPTVRYASCNTHECPPGTLDFREQQCRMWNNIPYNGKNLSWTTFRPVDMNNDPCSLQCKPKKQGEFFAVKLNEKVIDGTPCYSDEDSSGSRDICVNGKCVPVGCDGVLGSNKTEDKCRICGGDGSQCKTVREIHRRELPAGYNDIVMIPRGATNIRVQELAATKDFLAIRGERKEYFLHGNWTVDWPKIPEKFMAGGIRFSYTRVPADASPAVARVAESFHALGPLKEPIYIVVIHQGEKPEVEYEYSVHKDVPIPALNAPEDLYQYHIGDFGPCSRSCGGGTMKRIVKCVQVRYGVFADLSKCDPDEYQVITATCNYKACPPAYHAGKWSRCHCSGFRMRNVFCEKILETGERRVLDEKECKGMSRPAAIKECPKENCINSLLNDTTQDFDNNWKIGEWSKCDSRCGPGKRNRTVQCFDDFGNELNDTMCEQEKPAIEEICDLVPCEFADWVTSEWSSCDGNCASRISTRRVVCSTVEGKMYPDTACDSARRPSDTKECEKSECNHIWLTSEWTNCSVNCGQGIRTRSVVCASYHAGNKTKGIEYSLDAKGCPEPKPHDRETCQTDNECGSAEFAGPWNECMCGLRSRKTMCVRPRGKKMACPGDNKMEQSQQCNVTQKLASDGADTVPANATEQCCDREKCCPNGNPFNDTISSCVEEIVTQCTDGPFGCCPDTTYAAIGPFKLGCKMPCRLTRFGCCPDNITIANEDASSCKIEETTTVSTTSIAPSSSVSTDSTTPSSNSTSSEPTSTTVPSSSPGGEAPIVTSAPGSVTDAVTANATPTTTTLAPVTSTTTSGPSETTVPPTISSSDPPPVTTSVTTSSASTEAGSVSETSSTTPATSSTGEPPAIESPTTTPAPSLVPEAEAPSITATTSPPTEASPTPGAGTTTEAVTSSQAITTTIAPSTDAITPTEATSPTTSTAPEVTPDPGSTNPPTTTQGSTESSPTPETSPLTTPSTEIATELTIASSDGKIEPSDTATTTTTTPSPDKSGEIVLSENSNSESDVNPTS
ncbi:papilin-like isoform X2 [Brevipalpus obovatus]|uniref:papilin-like isoform X2 n=1 Tax=Brevipalpus obovatus TaxID=246614 RepID=UPI003D9ED355